MRIDVLARHVSRFFLLQPAIELNATVRKAVTFVLPTVLVLISTHVRLSADVILSDGMNTPGNYSGNALNSSTLTNPDDIGFLESPSTGNASGGNPGAWLQLTHNHDVERNLGGAPLNGNGTTFLQSFAQRQFFTYSPAVSGPIQDISFSLDINFPVTFGTIGLNQVFFQVGSSSFVNAAGFTKITGGPGWQTITVTGLTNADFSAQDFTGPGNLSFGFGFTSSGDVTAGVQSRSIGVDNFVVSINAVPEPSSLLLVSSMLVAWPARFRRVRHSNLPLAPLRGEWEVLRGLVERTHRLLLNLERCLDAVRSLRRCQLFAMR